MSGKMNLASIIKSEPYEIEYVIQSVSNKTSFTIYIAVEKESPNLISAMRLSPGGAADNTAPPQANKKEEVGKPDIEKIKIFLAEQAKLDKFSGSALVARDGKPLLHETYGYANKRFKVPNKPDTKFNLASLNKSFTSVAILQLVEAGKIKIDDPVGKYLDYFPKDIAEKVKIRHLLNMTNGWGDYWGNEYYLAHKDELRSVSDYIEFIKNIPLSFEPDTKNQHSNIGFEVAGAIIEKVTGMDYFKYIRDKIYKPAGMSNSDSYDRDGPVDNLAVGYTNGNSMDKINTGYNWENTYMLAPRGTPAGGGYSTAEDMLKYDTAIRIGKLVGKEYINFMNNQYRGNIGDPYDQQRIPRGAGGALGASTFYARDNKNGYTIIVLTNYDHPTAINAGNEIIKLLGLE